MFGRLFVVQAIVIAAAVGFTGIIVLTPSEYSHLAVIAAVAALVAALPAWLVFRLYDQPLSAIRNRAESLAAGDLDARVYVGSSGEVRALAQSFNAMGERLTERFALLEGDRRRLRGILDGLVEGVVALDSDERVVFANDRAGQLLEMPSPRAVGKKFWEVVRHRPVQELVRNAMSDRMPKRAELEWPAATPRSLAVYAAPLAGSQSPGLIVVLHDVTELRRLERLRQEFVANVSHELKTPLAVIKACVETLIHGAADDLAHRGGFLDQIHEQSDRLHLLILDLLRLARVEAGDAPPEIAPVELAPLICACVERHRARAESKHLRLKAIPADQPVIALADAEAVDTILDNLIDNAIKYTPTDGSVEIRWSNDETGAKIEVADTGIGIPEADLPRIFERFYRVDKARSRELGGTGLGLSIVKHLAQSMGGSVAASSTLERGSTLTVYLPVSK